MNVFTDWQTINNVREPLLLERFDITLPSGTPLYAALYRVPSRRTGRRVVVRDGAGALLHDTGEAYDLGNALNRLEWWLAGLLPVPAEALWSFEAGRVPAGPGIWADVYYPRWKAGNVGEQTPAPAAAPA